MSIQTEITRLNGAKTTLKNKGVELGISLATDKLDVIATKFDTNLVNKGAVSAQVKEGESYTIPKGYHNGSGTVAGVSGGGSYTLQSKTATPTKNQQNITSDDGFYGLSDVTIEPIPPAYQDVSGVTASAEDVLVTKVIVDATGGQVAGTMPNNNAIDATINGLDVVSYVIPKGYHNGLGTIGLSNDIENALAAI